MFDVGISLAFEVSFGLNLSMQLQISRTSSIKVHFIRAYAPWIGQQQKEAKQIIFIKILFSDGHFLFCYSFAVDRSKKSP